MKIEFSIFKSFPIVSSTDHSQVVNANDQVCCFVNGQTIGKLLIDEAKFLWVVEGKVEYLQKELKLIRCLLRDADTRQGHDQAVGECRTTP